jgi:bis(5'-nucleosidyl)-tetraphosphatase
MQPKEISYGFIVVRRTEEGDRFLLVKQHANWSFPKGHIDEGEDPLTCAKRELFEETGISDIQIIPDVSFSEEYMFDRNGVETKKENTFFLCFVDSTMARPQEGEIAECRFVSYQEAMNIFVFENPKRILAEAVAVLSKN